MCGIFGIHGNEPDVSRLVYYGLWTLQHRGQENSGITCSNGKRIISHKGKGLVAHVYNEDDINKLKGHIAIGHNRYSTFGKTDIDHSQPVYYHQNTVALAHNGNLPVVTNLKKFLTREGVSTIGLNDSEMMLKSIEYWVVKGTPLPDAIRICFPLFTGAFSLLIMTKNELAAVRDRFGIRPLALGRLNGSYIFSSETCAFDAIGATYIRDVEPGEMVIVNKTGLHSFRLAEATLKLDTFELIYFARPDSILLGQSVYEVRKRLGSELAKEAKVTADIVIPVPDSAIPAATGYSEQSKIPLEHALVKNRYIHRTFIKPAQKQRTEGVRMKLNIISHVVKGKSVALVDDSIVRGTTSRRLAALIRACGAKEVHLLIPSPPVRYPDFYGIDTPKQSELVAANMSLAKLKDYIGVDTLQYL